MIVLGIDPGLANAGYGVVARRRQRLVALDGGVIETRPELALEARLASVHARVLELIEEHRPAAMALEQLYFGQNVQTAFAVGHARGVTMLAAGQRGLPCSSYTPQRIKSSVCGNGRASKDQVARMVQSLLELSELPRPDHAADALAAAICHHNAAPLAAARQSASVGSSTAEPAARTHAGLDHPPRARARDGAPLGAPR
jgi:crossover junction endodeoxyribonuclease RuvC